MRFGTLLSRLRQQAGYSQKQLAVSMQWDQSYLSKIENGNRKPPSREMVIAIGRRMNLSQEDIDQLLFAAAYQPQTLLEIGVDEGDTSLKKQVGVLKEIRESVPLPSYLHAQEEISDFLEILRIKYLQKVNPTFTQNTFLADIIYAKVKRGGVKALYDIVNHAQGGAIVIYQGKILLAPIGISPLRGVWHIPAGFVNLAKGDRTAKDIALRLVKRYLPNAEVRVGNELTGEGGSLYDLDTTSYSLKLGFFPAPVQVFAIDVQGDLSLAQGAIFCAFSDIAKLGEGVHPLLYDVIKPFVKNKRLIKQVYERGEFTVREIIQKINYQQDMQRFYGERIKKSL
jgi:transcriptional regulator with XRE-family HTH domain